MYPPAEDSYFLREEVKKYLSTISSEKRKKSKVLDMGSGSGIQAEACLQAGVPKKNILAADLDKEVMLSLKKRGFRAIHSNLFSKIKQKFDLIIFNPPYLPADPKEKGRDTTGGKKGYETILKFLWRAQSHLKKEGKIFLLFSSLSKPKIIKEYAKKYYHLKEKSSKKLFFEELFVIELSHNLK